MKRQHTAAEITEWHHRVAETPNYSLADGSHKSDDYTQADSLHKADDYSQVDGLHKADDYSQADDHCREQIQIVDFHTCKYV
jgi:hypothetical protein